MEAWVNSGLLQGWGTGYNSVCTRPFEEGGHYLRYPYHSLVSGQTTGREHSPVHQQKTGLKTYSELPVSVQESLGEVWVSGGLLQGQGH